MLPHVVQHGLHVPHATDDGQYCVLLRHDDTVLAKGAIAAVSVVPAAPELVTVPNRPIGIGLGIAVVGV